MGQEGLVPSVAHRTDLEAAAALVFSFPTGHREPVTWEWQEAKKLGGRNFGHSQSNQLARKSWPHSALYFPLLKGCEQGHRLWKIQLGFLKSSSQLHHEILDLGS